MIKFNPIYGLLILLLLLTGCQSKDSVTKTDAQPSDIKNKTENTQPLIIQEKEPRVTLNQQEAVDRKVLQYIQGIMQGNPKLIMDLMDNGSANYYGMERTQAAIEDYRIVFGNSKLLYKFDSIDDYGHEKYYRYLIYTDDGKEIGVNFAARKDGIYIIGDSFLTYSWFAHQKISRFNEALARQNEKEVASALQEDDLWYPAAQANLIIKKYREAFELNTITYRLAGINEREDFIYVISGEKNGVYKEHQLTIVCGDTLAVIRDEWVPSIQEVGLYEPENP